MIPNDPLRVVLDTDVFLAGLIQKSLLVGNMDPNVRILDLIEANAISLVINPRIISDYEEKIKKGVADGSINENFGVPFFNMANYRGLMDGVLEPAILAVSDDPKDNMYFQSDHCLGADYFVTINPKFKPAQRMLHEAGSGLQIVSPDDFLGQYDSAKWLAV